MGVRYTDFRSTAPRRDKGSKTGRRHFDVTYTPSEFKLSPSMIATNSLAPIRPLERMSQSGCTGPRVRR